MSSATTPQFTVVRPKVFRPPAAIIAPLPSTPVAVPHAPRLSPWILGGAALASFTALIAYHQLSVSNQQAPLNPAPIPMEKAMVEPQGLLSPLSNAVASTLPPEAESTMIVLQGQSEGIVGQLARIPAEPEQITEIRPISEVDKTAGRELLSIVSKY